MTDALTIDWRSLEELLAGDPAGRGLASYRHCGRRLAEGQLEAAARSLAATLGRGAVGIATGFCVATDRGPAPETDGPGGALYLARACSELGSDVLLVSDRYTLPLLEAGAKLWRLRRTGIVEFPFPESTGPDEEQNVVAGWIEAFFSHAGEKLTHLVAVERPGPSHTLDSLALQPRDGAAPLAKFEREVPPASRDRCHSMRGVPIDAHTASLHRLFQAAGKHGVTTIGLADGGNEIGMGNIRWELLLEAIATGSAAQIACRVTTDYLVLAGISDWAAYALAAAAAALVGRGHLIEAWGAGAQRSLIEHLVHEAGAVDGVTGRRTATVDGVSLDEYLRTLDEIERVCRACFPGDAGR